MRIILTLLFTGYFLISGLAFGQITLDSCQQKARANFPLIKQFALIEQSKEFSLSNANKNFLPQLDITLIGGVINGLPSLSPPSGGEPSSYTAFNMISLVQLNQPLWDGGITKASKAVIEASSNMETADLEVSLYSLEERVNNLFFGTLLIDEQIAQLEILKGTLQRNMQRVEVAVENGTAFKSDIDELKVEVINTEQRMEELNFNRSAYLNMLAAMIGEPIASDAMLARPVLDNSFLNQGINRPELTLFQNHEALIEAQSKIDKAIMYPKVGIMGIGTFIQPGVDFGASTLNNILVGGLSVNWSLSSLYRNNNNKKLTGIKLQQVQNQRETFLFNTDLMLTQTRLELEKYQKLIAQDKELLELKSSIKKSYDVKYENGVSTMSQLLDKVNDESLAKQNLVVHELQYLMKAYQYKNKSGN
ncbi:TolC family protein [Flammeovirgaceae bacterium SG7u.111]|nr:TolC family protein [Flammeovirgaceae bacterium SG7u.132]WPO36306.1 TolC family protein [Flammeovirgaceae bacterium SG7u.111]